MDTLPLLRIGNKTPMEGVTETTFWAETKGWTIQRLPHPGVHPIISHQMLTLLHMPARICWKDPDIAVSCEAMPYTQGLAFAKPQAYYWDSLCPWGWSECIYLLNQHSWFPRWDPLLLLVRSTNDGPSICLSSKLCLCNSFHGCFVPNSKEGQSVHTLVSFILRFMHLANCILYLGYPKFLG